jgi:hypothetical protein
MGDCPGAPRRFKSRRDRVEFYVRWEARIQRDFDNGILPRSPGANELEAVFVLLGQAADRAEQFLAKHGARCRCECCRYLRERESDTWLEGAGCGRADWPHGRTVKGQVAALVAVIRTACDVTEEARPMAMLEIRRMAERLVSEFEREERERGELPYDE